MKNYNAFILVLVVAFFASCATTKNYIQIAQTLPTNPETLRINEDGKYFYQDENCKIVFDLWGEGGRSNFVVYNYSDEALVLCADECLITKEGYTNDMFSEAIGTAIAPHSFRSFSGLKLGYERIFDCDLSIRPVTNVPASFAYDLSSTPTRFSFYITYIKSISGEKKSIDFPFYISRVTNYLRSDIIQRTTESKTTISCENVPYSRTVTYNEIQYKYLFSPATGFYVKYSIVE